VSYNTTILNQLLQLIPRLQFETIARHALADRYVKHFTCWNQLVTLLYSQASGKDSLRDIEHGLSINDNRLYHLGLHSVRRSTLADANQRRDYKIFEGLFYKLLERCKDFTPKHKFKFKNPLYLLDATIITLCLSIFSWAKYGKTKGGIKLHYQLNHAGNIPSFLVITDAIKHESSVVKRYFHINPDSIYCFDRGYTDYRLFKRISDANAYFVTRTKDTMDYKITGQHTATLKKGILTDEVINLNNDKYTRPLRLIRYYDDESGELLEFVTNNFRLAPYTVTQIYKSRWQIEIFFKWIKQNLKIKTFLGTNRNAVMTQIWVAMCYYLLLTYVKYQSKYSNSLFYLHRIISETILYRINLIDLFRATSKRLKNVKTGEIQLTFL
jgi:hypothetical protein